MPKTREDFDATRPVELKVLTRGEDGTLFYPGEYSLEEIPEAAIEIGAIFQAPASEQIESATKTKAIQTEAAK